jgi:hypothetical protein
MEPVIIFTPYLCWPELSRLPSGTGVPPVGLVQALHARSERPVILFRALKRAQDSTTGRMPVPQLADANPFPVFESGLYWVLQDVSY